MYLSTETGLDTVGGLDGVDVGVELGVMRQLLPLDQGIGQGKGLGELGLGEGAEEGGVLVAGELTLIETVDGVRLGLNNSLEHEMEHAITHRLLIGRHLASPWHVELSLDVVVLGAEQSDGTTILGHPDGRLVAAQLGEEEQDIGLSHLL